MYLMTNYLEVHNYISSLCCALSVSIAYIHDIINVYRLNSVLVYYKASDTGRFYRPILMSADSIGSVPCQIGKLFCRPTFFRSNRTCSIFVD